MAAALQQASGLMLTRQSLVKRLFFSSDGIIHENLAWILLCKFPCFPVFTFCLNFAAMRMFRLTGNNRQLFELSAAVKGFGLHGAEFTMTFGRCAKFKFQTAKIAVDTKYRVKNLDPTEVAGKRNHISLTDRGIQSFHRHIAWSKSGINQNSGLA